MIEANRSKVAFALLQEPYVGAAKKLKNYGTARIFQNTNQGDGTIKAAIVVFDGNVEATLCPQFTTNNMVVVKIRTGAWEIVAVSIYFEPKPEPIEPYLEQLRAMTESIDTNMVIVGGDVNAKNPLWGSKKLNQRGEEVAETLDEVKLQVLNTGDTPTFDTVRGNKRYTSYVDVTACTEEMLTLVEDWRVIENLTSSDHNGIAFNIKLTREKGIEIQRTTRIYNTKKANWNQFREKLAQLKTENKMTVNEINKINNNSKLEQVVEKYMEIVIKTCNDTLPKVKKNQKLTLPWWSDELAEMKKEVTTRKRRIRCAAPVRRAKVVEEYLQLKNEYEYKAKKAQIDSWKEFCAKQDKEGLWGGIYRVLYKTTKRQEDLPLIKDGKVLDPEDSARMLAETFYPADLESEDNEDHRRTRKIANERSHVDHDDHDPPFTIYELSSAVRSFNPKKAPGADGLTADICDQTIQQDPELFLAIANQCLQLGYFPVIWKEATVVVLRKPAKDDYTKPKSYRPIGLLPVMGKILEKMIVGRLKWHLTPRISTRQYGFMPQKSTEDSLYDLIRYIQSKIKDKKLVTMISLDIEGAFDSAWWPAIKVRLAEEKCPTNIRRVMNSYLHSRSVKVRYAGREHHRTTTKGCVQGSIGGPILWNLLLDPLLKGLDSQGVYCQAFADDVVLIFSGDTGLGVQRQANAALAYVREWGIQNKLKFAPHKTCAMVLTRKLKYDNPLLSMGGVDIGLSHEIKILGLTVDQKLTFNTHVNNVCKKAHNVYRQLSRAAKISWGLHPEVIEVIYRATIIPIVTYAASAWAQETNKLGIQKQLNAVQRGFAQKLSKAYRTVSLNSALILAGLLPLDLRIREAATLFEAKRGVPQPALADREVEKRVAYTETPHPAENLCLEFVCLEDRQQVDNHNNQAVKIFTDGSKIEGKVGASLSIWSGDAETRALKLKLPQYCTVYQAELLAICRATGEILKRPEQSFGIYSDSRSALQTVTNSYSLHPLAVETRANIRNSRVQNKEISLFWIKAHAGLVGNERADELAKEAAKRMKRKPDYDLCPISFVKRQTRLDTLDEWNRRYSSGETAKVTKWFFPDAVEAYKIVKKLQPDAIITQVMTGHGGFSEYLNRFGCKEDPSCICEPGTKEDVEHILFECPVFGLLRHNIEQELDVEFNRENLHKVVKDKLNREKLFKYMRFIAGKVIRRNKTG